MYTSGAMEGDAPGHGAGHTRDQQGHARKIYGGTRHCLTPIQRLLEKKTCTDFHLGGCVATERKTGTLSLSYVLLWSSTRHNRFHQPEIVACGKRCSMIQPVDLHCGLAGLPMLKERDGHPTNAESLQSFATFAAYRDGGIYATHFRGSSGWERHPHKLRHDGLCWLSQRMPFPPISSRS